MGNTACNNQGVVEVPMPFGGTLKNLQVNVGTTGSSASSGTTTVYVDTIATSLQCQIKNTGTTCSDVTDSVVINTGDKISVRVNGNATSGETLANMRVGLQLQ